MKQIKKKDRTEARMSRGITQNGAVGHSTRAASMNRLVAVVRRTVVSVGVRIAIPISAILVMPTILWIVWIGSIQRDAILVRKNNRLDI